MRSRVGDDVEDRDAQRRRVDALAADVQSPLPGGIVAIQRFGEIVRAVRATARTRCSAQSSSAHKGFGIGSGAPKGFELCGEQFGHRATRTPVAAGPSARCRGFAQSAPRRPTKPPVRPGTGVIAGEMPGRRQQRQPAHPVAQAAPWRPAPACRRGNSRASATGSPSPAISGTSRVGDGAGRARAARVSPQSTLSSCRPAATSPAASELPGARSRISGGLISDGTTMTSGPLPPWSRKDDGADAGDFGTPGARRQRRGVLIAPQPGEQRAPAAPDHGRRRLQRWRGRPAAGGVRGCARRPMRHVAMQH